MEGGQGGRHDQRPDLAGVPQILPRPDCLRSGRGPCGGPGASACAFARPDPGRAAEARATPTGAGQFTSEAEAKARCPSDTVVWVNTKSHIYHLAGTRSYGTTKQGAYMCEADANAAGDRASKSRIGKKATEPQ